MTRYFYRLPAFETVEAAIEYAERKGGEEPRLFAIPSAPGAVVGSVEVRGDEEGRTP